MRTYETSMVQAFYENYTEIMLYYKNKRKQKADLIQQLIDDKEKVWTSKIPVYSTALRPFGVTTESIYFTGIEKHINPLTNITINLKKATPIEVPLYLYQSQMRVNELWAMNFGLIDSKYGWIRARILGGEWNYSG